MLVSISKIQIIPVWSTIVAVVVVVLVVVVVVTTSQTASGLIVFGRSGCKGEERQAGRNFRRAVYKERKKEKERKKKKERKKEKEERKKERWKTLADCFCRVERTC